MFKGSTECGLLFLRRKENYRDDDLINILNISRIPSLSSYDFSCADYELPGAGAREYEFLIMIIKHDELEES